MIRINGISINDCTRKKIIESFEKVIKQRDDLQNVNIVLNETIGQLYAQKQLIEAELEIIRKEIKALYDYKQKVSSN